jgi:hypothetical protein
MKKLFKWEFWPFWIFYTPVYLLYIWYSIRARSMIFFSATNPSMYMGGFVDYSKYDILMKIPEDVVPKTVLLEVEGAEKEAKAQIAAGNFNYPLILKPDMGERGFGVQKIDDEEELEKYFAKFKTKTLLQEFVDLPLEFGVLYYRYPDEERGHISSVVMKEFLNVIGDGKSTLGELFKKSERAQYYEHILLKQYKDRLNEVLPEGKKEVLVEIGNHSRGTMFLNKNDLINDKLIDAFDRISKQVDGYYFGRYDLRVASIEDLYEGKIMVMELNGANSEPAHIYDPNMPLFRAYRFLFKHWKTIFTIGRQNHKKGVPYMKSFKGIKVVREHFKRRKDEVVGEF